MNKTTVNTHGAIIPTIGFGTWTLRDQQASQLVKHAIDCGYRHIDTAAMYDNEQAVGAGIRASSTARENIFLTTKVWHTNLAESDFLHSVEASLKRLDVDHVDLLLVHWPSKTTPLAETIGALNKAAAMGHTTHIGVSNFNAALLTEAVQLSERPLVCNQIEYHPMLSQNTMLNTSRQLHMAVVSYCPLCRGGELFSGNPVAMLAQKYGKSPAQIVLRWQVQQDNVIAIPRSTNTERIAQNIEIYDFELSVEEMQAISALGSHQKRLCDFDFSPQWDLPGSKTPGTRRLNPQAP